MKQLFRKCKKPFTRRIISICAIIAMCMGIFLIPVNVMAVSQTKTDYPAVAPGDTINLNNWPDNCNYLVSLDQPGQYTITGNAGTISTGTFQINADIQLTLDSIYFVGYAFDDDNSTNPYKGGTHGTFQIADGKTVTLVLKGNNRLYGKGLYNEIKPLSFLLGCGSKLIIQGDGSLYSEWNLGRVMSSDRTPGELDMKSGTLEVDSLGNVRSDGTPVGYYTGRSSDLVLNYEGGSLYSKGDDQEQSNVQLRTWECTSSQDIYRVTVPAKGTTLLKRGDSVSHAIGNTDNQIFTWETTVSHDPVYYYVRSEDGYHRYAATISTSHNHSYTATLADDGQSIGGATGTVRVGDAVAANATLTFTSEQYGDFTGTTDANGQYTIQLPPSSYTISACLEGDTTSYPVDSWELTEEKTQTHDIQATVVKGKVTNSADSSAISNACVAVEINNRRYDTRTNDQGEYTLPLPVGTSTASVKATYFGFGIQSKSVTMQDHCSTADFRLTANTDADPHVSNEDDLCLLADFADELDDKTIIFDSDIALTGRFKGIRLTSPEDINIHGNGHTISNMTTPLFTESFLYKTVTGEVTNLHLEGDITSTCERVGAVFPETKGMKMENVSFVGSITGVSTTDKCGGLVGSQYSGEAVSFKNCYVKLSSVNLPFNHCHFGGLTDFCSSKTSISNCYVEVGQINMNNASTNSERGLFLGENSQNSTITIDNCYGNYGGTVGLYPALGIGGYQMTVPYDTYTLNNVFVNNDGNYLTDSRETTLPCQGGTRLSPSLMTAKSATQDAMIDSLNSNVTTENGYLKWYRGADGYPCFTPTYTVTVNHGRINGDTSASFTENKTVTVVADNAAQGERFTGWTVSPEIPLSSQNATTTFTMPSHDVTMTAKYEALPAPTIQTKPVAGDILLGQTLSDSTLSGGQASVPGSFAWASGSSKPTAADSDHTEFEVVFTPQDLTAYRKVTCTVRLKVFQTQDAPAIPTGSYDVSGTNGGKFAYTITAPLGGNLEFAMDHGAWQAAPSFDAIAPLSIHTFQARHPASTGFLVSPESSTESITFAKLAQAAPADFTLTFALNSDGVTYTATIPTVEGAEYSFDGTTWSDSNTKSDCEQETAYTGYCRMKETAVKLAGSSVTDTKTTAKVTPTTTPTTTTTTSAPTTTTTTGETAKPTTSTTSAGTVGTTVTTAVASKVSGNASDSGNQTVYVGSKATFKVTATGKGPFTYQWYCDCGAGFEKIAGATEAVYTTGGATMKEEGYRYRCDVTDSANQVVSSGVMTLHVKQTSKAIQTGEKVQPILGCILLMLSALGVVGMLSFRRRRLTDK